MSSHQNTLLVFSLSVMCACAPPAAEGSGTLDLTVTGEVDPDAELDLAFEVSQSGEVVASGAFESVTATVAAPAGSLEIIVAGSWSVSGGDTAGNGASGCEGGATVELADGEALAVEIPIACHESWAD